MRSSLLPYSILKWSNSTTLKSGLYIVSNVPGNSSVERVRIRFLMTSAARLESVRAFAISVGLMHRHFLHCNQRGFFDLPICSSSFVQFLSLCQKYQLCNCLIFTPYPARISAIRKRSLCYNITLGIIHHNPDFVIVTCTFTAYCIDICISIFFYPGCIT